MADVFLSYKREDAAKVGKLVAALRSEGLDVWWDEDIPPSAPWEATIEKALADAKSVIVCWSPVSVASENVRSEARVARQDGRLIQVFVKPCSPPLFFGERQGFDLTKWRGNADDPRIAKLAESVRKITPGNPVENRERPRSARVKKRLGAFALVALVLLVIGAGTLIAWRAAVARPAPEVAVLPFDDLSPTHDKGYFAQGIAEEILSSLGTDKAIRVLGRTSARQIDRNADPKALRKSLGITHLLEGSTRTAGDALRVDVRLIDTRDGTTVWQDEYQGRLSDVFSVQDKIASAVVRNVRGIFASAPRLRERPATKVDVYETYLAARAIMRKRTEPALRQALGLAQQVIATDPNYAPGQALYAELVFLLSDNPDAYGTIPEAKAAPIAEAHARTAIRLAPNLADGFAALGIIQRLDATTTIPALKRAIALDPSRADVRIWLAIQLTKACHYDEALEYSREAAALEPLWFLPTLDLGVRLAVNGQTPEARQLVGQFKSRTGKEASFYGLTSLIESRSNDISAAIADGEKALALDPSLPVRDTLLELFYVVGLEERAPKDLLQPVALARPFYHGDMNALDAQISSSGAHVWELPDRAIAFFHLASVHDWTTLNRLYDARPVPPQRLCFLELEAAQATVPALRAAGRANEAEAVLNCLRGRLAIESRQKSRYWYAYPGDHEYDLATLAAFEGNRQAALQWLGQAIDRGWLGRPYSSGLTDRPQFDLLRSDPRLAALQARIDRTIAQARAQVLAAGSR